MFIGGRLGKILNVILRVLTLGKQAGFFEQGSKPDFKGKIK